MNPLAVVLEAPERLDVRPVSLVAPIDGDVIVDVEWSGISTGTERLLYTGAMPQFPGMGYPLVPGYECVGRVMKCDASSGLNECDRVFVPGARCFGDIKGLFGGSASRVVTPAARVVRVADGIGEEATLLALAATAYHAVAGPGAKLPELIVGHGVLGRLIARVTKAVGGNAPVVWENNESRRGGAHGYQVIDPADDAERGYASICDASGSANILDTLIGKLSPGGEVTLAGFYETRLGFDFPPAFMREARIRVAAEWKEQDLHDIARLIADGHLSLAGLITHHSCALDASSAYRTAFSDPNCLKMILDWRNAK